LDLAEPLVRERLRSIVRLGGGSEPALVDAAAMSTERIVVVRVQLEPLPRYAERAGHPARPEPQDAVALVQSGLDLLPVSSHFLDLATCGIRPMPDEEVERLLPEVDVLIGQTPMPRARLDRASKLKAIFNVETNFLPNIDYQRCQERGIWVLSPAAAFAVVVAESALSMAV